MNIAFSFANFLEVITGSTLGQTLFIGQAPSSNKVNNAIWWIVASGGNRTTDAATGESIKQYVIEVYYRSRDYKAVYDAMQDLELKLNCDDCVQLENYDTLDVKASVLGIDNDLDAEDRKVGLLQANLTVYQRCADVS
jgi:hypothetical protein